MYGKQVTFFHDSLRDFFLQCADHEANFLVTSHEEVHTQLSLICIETILYKSTFQVPEIWQHDADSKYGLLINKHIFLSYAIGFWLMHFQQAVPNGTSIECINKQLIIAVKGIIDL